MTLRISIDCYCEYKCNCKPIPQTKVTKQQIAYNLIRCNPALARYFSSNLKYSEIVIDKKQIRNDSPKQYKSIVEQKNMNILLADKNPMPIIPQKEEALQIQINNYIDNYVQTSPKNFPQQKNPNIKPKKKPNEEQIKEYFQELKQTSRYLSNTAFRKYFNRPIFENYGRQNTKGTSDGIIYGNYLKTHNINPHSGQNRPHDEETFYHALITASPQKFISPQHAKLLKQQKGRNLSLTRLNQNESIQKPLKKHDNNQQEIIIDNLNQHDKLNKLSQTKLSPKSVTPRKNINIALNNYQKKYSPVKQSKSPMTNKIKSPTNINSQYVNRKQIIQSIKPKQNENKGQVTSPIAYQNTNKSNINKLSEIKKDQNQKQIKNIKIEQSPIKKYQPKCPVEQIRQNHMQHILSKKCNVQKSPVNLKVTQKTKNNKQKQKIDFGPGSPKACKCTNANGSKKCQCLSKVKNQLKQKAANDVDLNNRLITSARKATLYKNYALNNVQNSKLDPHNYNHCSGALYQA